MTSQKHVGEVRELYGGRESLKSALKTGVVLQAVLFVVTACMLDGGQLFSQFLVAMIGYWLGVAFIVARRGMTPSKLDLLFIRYGSLVLLVLAPLVAKIVYRMIGESPLNGLERWL